MKKKLLWLIPILLLAYVGYVIFFTSYQPTDVALSTYEAAKNYDGYYAFENDQSDIGIIFYPGGRVDERAYAPLAKLLSSQYNVYVSQMPIDLAIFGNNKAAEIIPNHDNINSWYMMGHSLGGVMAAQYAYENESQIDGLILLASYPQATHDFSNSELTILSILGTNDTVLNPYELEQSMKLLPPSAFKYIEGGNHGQMGNYGEQKRDSNATITSEEQQQIIFDFILKEIS